MASQKRRFLPCVEREGELAFLKMPLLQLLIIKITGTTNPPPKKKVLTAKKVLNQLI